MLDARFFFVNPQKPFSKTKRLFAIFAFLLFNILQSQIYISQGTSIYVSGDETIIYSEKGSQDSEAAIYRISSVEIKSFDETAREVNNRDKISAKRKIQKQKILRSEKKLTTKEESLKRKHEVQKNLPQVNFTYHTSQDYDKSFGISEHKTTTVVPSTVLKLKIILLAIHYSSQDFCENSADVFSVDHSNILFSGFKGIFSARPPPGLLS